MLFVKIFTKDSAFSGEYLADRVEYKDGFIILFKDLTPTAVFNCREFLSIKITREE